MAGPSKGSKPAQIIRDALLLELNRMTNDDDGNKIKKVNRIVHKLVEAGMAGKIDAIKEIWDRAEGRATQALAVSGDGEGGAIKTENEIRPAISRDEWLKLHSNGVKDG